ncbi:hypothetical protein U8607_24130 [Methylobacterium durans]|uniref:hypothetical protein n=1 Tax=Methylobacterium durans TaxID=2202825 RepID=UPI002AFF3962|nr:hypothetical protein [Methylobacterium durans]MEA1835179.1 hypothetical protein [Methylobacterium durans]
MTDRSIPRLRALLLPAAAHHAARAVTWCPYCEKIHYHGPVSGHRVAHCTAEGSPYAATGYDLDLQGEASAAVAVVPVAIYANRRRLGDVLERAAPTLRAVFLGRLFGRSKAKPRFEKRIGRARLSVSGGTWALDPDGFPTDGELITQRPWVDRTLRGRGLVDLLVTLYGVPPGIVVMRLLQAVLGERFDPQAWSDIAAAVDAWAERRTTHQEGGR